MPMPIRYGLQEDYYYYAGVCVLQGMISLDQQEKLKELADSMMATV